MLATITIHAAKKMAADKLTERMVRVTIAQGTRYYDFAHGSVVHVLEGGLASGHNLIAAVNYQTGAVKTVMRSHSRWNPDVLLEDGTQRYYPLD